MTRILVVGANTVAGTNLAARFATDHETWTTSAVPGCRLVAVESDRPDDVLASLPSAPDWIVVADTAGEWGVPTPCGSPVVARSWATAAEAAGIDVCLVSTAAVFDGPRLFRTEVGAVGSSRAAVAARQIEEAVLEACPTALVARTTVFGWSPNGRGWIETRLAELERGRASADTEHGGTPLHAATLGELLLAAREAGLRGVWHAGGAERVDEQEFCRRLARHLGQAWRSSPSTNADGPSESSLCSSRLAASIDRPLPMIDEDLARLAAECDDGIRDALLTGRSAVEPLVA